MGPMGGANFSKIKVSASRENHYRYNCNVREREWVGGGGKVFVSVDGCASSMCFD